MSDRAMIFVHEGKAAYPDIRAYMDYFRGHFDVREATPDQAAAMMDIGQAICWHMMGLYPRRLPCALTIHDYRSLSVGRGRRVKDAVKRLVNVRPDIRIFQNEAIRRALRFAMDADSLYLPMGVPSDFVANRSLVEPITTDFIYIGSMLAERRCERMIDSFLKRFGATRSFELYGPPNPELEARYQGRKNVRFRGLIAQADLPRALKAARVGVNFFPDHYPHVLQTPTKLLEYGALGMRILSNEHPQSRITAEQYGLSCRWGPIDDLFADVPDALSWADNMAVNPGSMEWPAVIRASGIEELLTRRLGG